MKMDGKSFNCPVCGGTMNRVKVLPKEVGAVIRYKCTCGHCEDIKHERDEIPSTREREFVLDGFHEVL